MTKNKKAEMSVGDKILPQNAKWHFGGKTPDMFNTHVRKSVPFYDQGHKLIEWFSDYFVHAGSDCYEIGCSTGKLARKLALHQREASWTGIDVELDMIAQANKDLQESNPGIDNLTFIADSALSYDYLPSDFIISYYTLQFIHPRERQTLVDRIYQSLNWGGAFVVFEKVRAPDARFQDIANSLYVDYKIEQGYSPAEIISKTKSLKGILEPFSTQGNLDIFKRAGFVDVMSVFKYVCFEGFLCIK